MIICQGGYLTVFVGAVRLDIHYFGKGYLFCDLFNLNKIQFFRMIFTNK